MLYKISLEASIYLFLQFTTLLCIKDSFCYPIEKNELEEKLELRDEKYYPNGTVVGKYAYTDKKGNPIQVKYFADDSSYGVELKSIKVIDSNFIQQSSLGKINYVTKVTNPPNTHPFKIIPGLLNEKYFTEKNKYKENDFSEYLKDVPKVKHFSLKKPNSDYDIFYETELKGPEKYGKDKVRIYSEKPNRKIRNTLNTMPKFCEMI